MVQVCLTLFLYNNNLWIWENMKNTGWFLTLFIKCFIPRRCLDSWLAVVCTSVCVCVCVCVCVWDWGRTDAASCCNDDEAVFVVVAVLSLAASWSGWRRWSLVTTQVRRIMERAE